MLILNFIHAVCAWYARVYTWYAEKIPHTPSVCKLPMCQRCRNRDMQDRARKYREAGIERARTCVNCANALTNGDDYSGCWLHRPRSQHSFELTDEIMANSVPATAEDVRHMMRAFEAVDQR